MFDGILRDVSDIKKVTAVGTGGMGPTTALAFAMSDKLNIQVTLCGRSDKKLEMAMAKIRDALLDYAAHSLIEEARIPFILGRIHPVTMPDPVNEPERRKEVLQKAWGDADLFIDSIDEKLDAKHELFAEADGICKKETMFASNSSAIIPSLIAEVFKLKNPASTRTERFINLHFWNPPERVPLVEIIPGKHTSPVITEVSYALMVELGKAPVRVLKEEPGFIGNRLQIALLREALHIYESGMASRETIDTAVTNGFGRELATIGLIEGARNDGFDKLHQDYEQLEIGLCNDVGVPTVLQELVALGKLGGATGEGLYVWAAEELAETKQRRGAELIRHLIADIEERNRNGEDFADATPIRPVAAQKDWKTSCAIERRLRHALLREAFYIVNSGIANAKDVDLVVKYSIGRRLPITGPLVSADLGGLQIFQDIFKTLGKHLCNDPHIPYLAAHAAKVVGYGKAAESVLVAE